MSSTGPQLAWSNISAEIQSPNDWIKQQSSHILEDNVYDDIISNDAVLIKAGKAKSYMPELDAKIEASEARTDTKFAQMMGELTTMRAEINGKFETLSTRLDHVEGATKGMRSTVIGTGIGVVAVIIAVMAYGAQWFGLGLDSQSISDQAAKNVLIQAQPRLDNLEKQIGVILTAIEAQKKAESPVQPTPNQ